MTPRNTHQMPVNPPAREEEIRRLVDDAHASLASDALAEVLLAASETIETADAPETGDERPAGRRRDTSREARAYLRPIERLVRGQALRTRPLPASRRGALLTYIEDVAARPRGAGLPA